MMFYKSREGIIQFYDDSLKIVNIAVSDEKHGKRFKLLTTKQMLQRLPIALAQVKTRHKGNTSENLLLSEIRQII